ncbi:MAG: hypothetical protein KF709_06320 [Gemmatimonadaceae bacterium]|nr:hypothetical protein [Gemmatimonadaceae bacterium]
MRVAPFPFLVAAWFALVQWRQAGLASTGRLGDLLTSVLGALAVAALGTLVGRAVTKDAAARGLVALTVVAWGALYSSYAAYAVLLGLRLPVADSVLLWTLLCGLAVFVASRLTVGEGFVRALSIGSGLLVLFQVFGAATAMRTVAGETHVGSGRSAERPDIYLFVLDKYTASPWLSATYGVDNRAFEDSLRQLGFVLPPAARTNYPHTSLVLATLLDGAPVHETVNDSTARWPAVFARVEQGAMIAALQERGYRFAFFPTTFHATSQHPRADIRLTQDAARRATWFHSWRANGPFDALIALRCGRHGCQSAAGERVQAFPYPLEAATAIRWKFETVRTLPDSSGPIFSFVHALLPHEPYQFSADCEPQEPWWPVNDADADAAADSTIRAAYAAQVRCANRLVLETVGELIRRSKIPPVILIQSDHGHGRMTEDAMSGRTVPLVELTATQLRERLDVFAAYRVPGHPEVFPDNVTPASVLPRTLNALFNAGLAVPDDRTWWVDAFRQPLRVTPIPPERLRLSRDAPPSP